MKEVGNLAVFAYNGFHMPREENPGKRKTGDRIVAQSHEDRYLRAFDEYADALFRHAMYRISDRERAIEIVHDTFTKVWGYVRDGHEIEAYRPFLYKVMNNLIIDEYRRRKEVSLDALLAEEGTQEGSFEELYEGGVEELAFSMDARKAADLIHDLPPSFREVITLRFVDGLGPKEISALIEETENVVSVRIHRALKLLKEQIEKAEETARERRTKELP